MNTKLSLLAAVALGFFASANGLGLPQFPATTDLWTKYPSSFPFENVKVIPPNPGGQDNVLDVDDPTIGGYQAKAMFYCNIFAYTPYGVPAGKGHCGHHMQYFVYQLFEMEFSYLSPFNCSAGSYIFQPPLKGFFGNGPVVCEPDKCCPEFVGNYFPSLDWPSLQDKWDTRYVKYYCQWYTHEVYCQILFWEQGWCMYQWAQGGAEDRHTMIACFDVFFYFYEQCRTLKQIGAVSIAQGAKLEPDDFISAATPAQVNSLTAIFWTVDRVCDPMCVYKPDECNEAGGAAPADAPADGSAPAGDSTPAPSTPAPSTPASSDDSASALTGAPVMLFAAMMSVFAFGRL